MPTERIAVADYRALVAGGGRPALAQPIARPDTLALGRLKAGAMNKTEAAYAAHLEMQKAAGEVLWFAFEAWTFKLADDCRYTPDFPVMLASGAIEIREVKGHWRDDAKVKIRVAASLFPFRFVAIRAVPAREGGGWSEQVF